MFTTDSGWKRLPEIAKLRAELANAYRKTRAENPPLARLIRRGLKEAMGKILWGMQP